MNNRVRTRAVLAIASSCALAASATATARTTHSTLRVEAGGKALDVGTNYSNRSIGVDATGACGGDKSGGRVKVTGAKALGIVGHAARVNPKLSPLKVGRFEGLGLFVCRIGDFKGSSQSYWLYKVNHEAPSVGGDQFSVGRGDDVLWYFVSSSGRNSGDELDLENVPARVEPNKPFRVKAVSYTWDGARSPAQGVNINGALGPTNSNGVTTVVSRATPGTMRVRGRRGNDVPTAPVAVCVHSDLSKCPARRGETFIGTGRDDEIRATRGADAIRPRAGEDVVRARGSRDRIKVRDGERDRVNCGAGRDVVFVDRRDVVADNCEVVKRR